MVFQLPEAYEGLRVVPEPAGISGPTRALRFSEPTAGSDILGLREGGFGWGRVKRADLGLSRGKGESCPPGGGGEGGGKKGSVRSGPGGRMVVSGSAYGVEGGS